jgi:hypothetical protein
MEHREIKRVISGYYKQLYGNKSDNLEKNGKIRKYAKTPRTD